MEFIFLEVALGLSIFGAGVFLCGVCNDTTVIIHTLCIPSKGKDCGLLGVIFRSGFFAFAIYITRHIYSSLSVNDLRLMGEPFKYQMTALTVLYLVATAAIIYCVGRGKEND